MGGGGGGAELPPPHPIVSSIKNRAMAAEESTFRRRWGHVRAKHSNSRRPASSKLGRLIGTYCGRRPDQIFGTNNGANPREVVVTFTVTEPLPVPSMLGVTVQVVPVAAKGSEQNNLTCELKP